MHENKDKSFRLMHKWQKFHVSLYTTSLNVWVGPNSWQAGSLLLTIDTRVYNLYSMLSPT